MYNCVAARPDTAGQTKNESIEPQTETLSLTATSIYVAALETDVVKAEANATTDATAYNGWNTAVYIPA